jgi:hypothetical protein
LYLAGCSGIRSQGGVKVPTGGKGFGLSPRALSGKIGKVSRSGVIPEPTVKVRMKENEVRLRPWSARGGLGGVAAQFRVRPGAVFVVLICPGLCWSFGKGKMT